MKRINKISVILPILLLMVFQNNALAISITSVSVVPSQPLDTDLITLNVFGMASMSSSWVDHDVFSQNGTALQLDLYVDMGDLTSPSNWNYSKQIQPLGLGTYDLEVSAFDNYGRILKDTYTTSFTVTPEPATIFLLGLGIILARKKLA